MCRQPWRSGGPRAPFWTGRLPGYQPLSTLWPPGVAHPTARGCPGRRRRAGRRRGCQHGQVPDNAPDPAQLPAVDREALAALRRTYLRGRLDVADLAADPFTQFSRWLAEALGVGLPEPNAMVFATADADGQPSARTVLLKDVDDRGFVLYTNYGSRKGREASANPRASLVFPWFPMERQVVVVGAVEQVSREESAAYFHSRPRESQLGAWASPQSTPIASRQELEDRLAELAERWPEGTEVPLPEHWGGLRVVPATVEFWQGGPARLHDRLRYERSDDGWSVRRLAP